MSLRMPAEHGAWGLLAVPFASAVAIGGVGASQAWPLVLVTLAILSAFLLRTSLEGCTWRAMADPPNLGLGVIGLGSGFALLFFYGRWPLIWLALAAALLYLVQRSLVHHHDLNRASGNPVRARRAEKRSLAAELVGVSLLSLTAPAAWVAIRGHLESAALELWAGNLLFFLGGVLYVKYRVRGLHAHRSFRGLGDRIGFAWPVFVYHLALIAFLAGWILMAARPVLLILAFAPGIFRAFQLAFQLGERFPIRRLGWSEVAHSVVFATLLILAFRFSH
jgi:hypothetical protein